MPADKTFFDNLEHDINEINILNTKIFELNEIYTFHIKELHDEAKNIKSIFI